MDYIEFAGREVGGSGGKVDSIRRPLGGRDGRWYKHYGLLLSTSERSGTSHGTHQSERRSRLWIKQTENTMFFSGYVHS